MSTQQLPLLRLEQVSLTAQISSHYLLKDISFEVFPGEFVALVGPTGAGKTSLLRLLNRLSEPTSGSIYLEDREYRHFSSIKLRRKIILVLQESKLLGMKVREALAYPLILRDFRETEIQDRLTRWMEKLQIPNEWLDRTEVQLSGGQRQLVALCRALAIQPQILLLDEPTSALDAARAPQILQILRELVNAKPDERTHESNTTTVLMANHQLDLASQFCTRVLHLQRGEVVQYLPSSQMDWDRLRKTFQQTKAEADQEWSE